MIGGPFKTIREAQASIENDPLARAEYLLLQIRHLSRDLASWLDNGDHEAVEAFISNHRKLTERLHDALHEADRARGAR